MWAKFYHQPASIALLFLSNDLSRRSYLSLQTRSCILGSFPHSRVC